MTQLRSPYNYHHHHHVQFLCSKNNDNEDISDAVSTAERLMDEARKIRESIPELEQTESAEGEKDVMNETNDDLVWYRLYVDIGREEGTWMEPRWGASGNRIEFTLDVGFTDYIANEEIKKRMVKDNLYGKSSSVKVLRSSTSARLRRGFDSMKCNDGGWRIDGESTVRFHVNCNGTPEQDTSYGDIFIPSGQLHFSIPCFANSVSNLSRKMAPVTIRQKGWHTGWLRYVLLILSYFRAKSIFQSLYHIFNYISWKHKEKSLALLALLKLWHYPKHN